MSIAKKVTLVVSLFAALLLLGSGYASLVYGQREMVRRVRREAKVMTQIIKYSTEAALDDAGHLGIIEDMVARRMPVQITFYGRDGRAVAPAPTQEEVVVSSRARRVVEKDAAEEELVDTTYAYRVPLHDTVSGKVAGALELRFDLEALRGQGWPSAGLLVAGGLLILFALLVGLFSATAIQKPIIQLMDGMDHIIRGDLTHTLPLDRNDEIGRIAYRFNEMTAQLRDAQQEIQRSAEAKLQLEQRVRQSEKLATIGQLSAEIAHEVGTPLNVIGGRARSLKRKADQPAEVTKNAEIIADQAERITKIIQQMLNLSRARTPERTDVSLAQILEDVLSLLEHQVRAAGIQVVRDLASALPPVQGDTDGLQQVFINLIHNAVQAMSAGGTLTLRATEERRRKEGLDLAPPQQYVAVEVGDTGEGLSEEQQSQIFEPFYSTKKKGEGTGLGLTVALGIVKEHDGWIEVQQTEPRGAVFRVYLPISQEGTL